MSGNKPSDGELQFIEALAQAGGIDNWLTAPSIAAYSRKRGQELNSPTVYRVLTRLGQFVEYRTVKGVRRFHLKQNGRVLLRGASDLYVFVAPGTPYSTQRELKSFLATVATKSLLVIDPYISGDTLDVLAEVPGKLSILSRNLGRKDKEDEFLRVYKKFKREKDVELRRAARDDLHGRYLFTEKQGWVIDHSLQDLGTKPALILPLHLERVFNSTKAHFEELFKAGEVIE